MPLDPSAVVTRDHLAIAGEPVRFDFEAGLFTDLAQDRLDERFTYFDNTAGKGVKAVRRRLSPANDQHAPVPKNGGADRNIGVRWINSRFATVTGQKPDPFKLLSGHIAADVPGKV